MELREKVARGMAAQKGLDWDGKAKGTEYANHGYWLPLAQAAIDTVFAELREVTLAMADAGVDQWHNFAGSIDEECSAIFLAMLDAAQKGE